MSPAAVRRRQSLRKRIPYLRLVKLTDGRNEGPSISIGGVAEPLQSTWQVVRKKALVPSKPRKRRGHLGFQQDRQDFLKSRQPRRERRHIPVPVLFTQANELLS